MIIDTFNMVKKLFCREFLFSIVALFAAWYAIVGNVTFGVIVSINTIVNKLLFFVVSNWNKLGRFFTTVKTWLVKQIGKCFKWNSKFFFPLFRVGFVGRPNPSFWGLGFSSQATTTFCGTACKVVKSNLFFDPTVAFAKPFTFSFGICRVPKAFKCNQFTKALSSNVYLVCHSKYSVAHIDGQVNNNWANNLGLFDAA